jgi:hypothetical protein
MHPFRFVTLFIPALTLCACASVSYSPSSACTAFGKEIKVLSSMPKDGTYNVCGSLSVQGSRFTDREEANSLFLEQARSHGANAVVIIDTLQDSFNWTEGYNKKSSAVAIQLID